VDLITTNYVQLRWDNTSKIQQLHGFDIQLKASTRIKTGTSKIPSVNYSRDLSEDLLLAKPNWLMKELSNLLEQELMPINWNLNSRAED